MDTRQSKGGISRANKLSQEQRSQIARLGAQERWSKIKDLPRATHGSADRPLKIGNAELACYVLEDGRRVISQRGMNTALARAEASAKSRRTPFDDTVGNLPSFLFPINIRPYITNDLIVSVTNPISFKLPNGSAAAYGYLAELLPEVCSVWIQAKDAGVLAPSQMRTAEAASVIVQALAKVGIVALVDEATGYQEERNRDELHRLLSVYLAEERLAWAKRFPDEFYKQIYRLKGWKWPVGIKKTPLLGHITNDIVYDRLPPGVLNKLRELNPTNDVTKRRKWKHHQFLSQEVGQPDLRDHILQLIPVMKISKDWTSFTRHVDVAFPKLGTQLEMNIDENDGC